MSLDTGEYPTGTSGTGEDRSEVIEVPDESSEDWKARKWGAPETRPAPDLSGMTWDDLHALAWSDSKTWPAIKAELARREARHTPAAPAQRRGSDEEERK